MELKKEINKTLQKLEFLINEQYSRIVEALETESEEKDLLKPNKHLSLLQAK